MKISILPRREMQSLIDEHGEKEILDRHKIVSIFDNDGPVFNRDHENLLSLRFRDITSGIGYNDEDLFSFAQADQAVEFIDKLGSNDDFIVHCGAGISRSGAVGIFTALVHGEGLDVLLQRHQDIWPNRWVFRLLAESYRRKHPQWSGIPDEYYAFLHSQSAERYNL
jgi:predicted protein tyrosine phosphatase